MTRRVRLVVEILALAFLYLGVARMFLTDGHMGSFGSLIWIPSGIALSAVILRGWRLWPGIALGVFLAVVTAGHSWRSGLWIAGMDSLEALAGYYLLVHRLRIHTSLDRVRDAVALVAVACAVTFVTTAIAIGGLSLVSALPPEGGLAMWASWWWGHLAADLIVVPVLLTWCTRSVHERARSQAIEALLLASVVIVASLVVFDRSFTELLPGSREPYYLMPVLVWAGVRFGPRGASVTASTVGLIAIVGTLLDTGPFHELTDLQSFVSISSVTTLVLSALAFERLQAVRRKTAIQRGALDAIITIDAAGRVVELNPAAESLFGHREADVVGRELASLVMPPEVRDKHREALRGYNGQRDSAVVGKRVRFAALRADGTEFPAEISVTRIAVDGEYMFTGFVRDVTAEQLAETSAQRARDELARVVRERTAELVDANARLARKQEMLGDAQELAHVGSFEIDVDHEQAEWSDELERIYGRAPVTPAERYTGLFESVHPDDRERVAAAISLAIADRQPFSIEQRIVRPDGSIRLVQSLGRARVDGDGGGPRIRGCCQDITERKHAEAARDRLGELVESSDAAIIGLALDGTIESWNAAATKVFGYPADDAIGKPASILVDVAERKDLVNVLDSIRKGHRLAHYELVHRRRDGTRFDASVTTSAIVDHQGRVIGLSKVLRDISDQKAVETRLRASLREKEILLREIYHRVKNNLQVISSLLNLQVNAEPSEAARHGLLESQSRIQSMALVHQLLYQSKDLARVDFSEYLNNLCARLMHTYHVGEERIVLEVDAESVLVDIDHAIPCGLIVNELVTNALNHAFPDGRHGRIVVSLQHVGDLLRLAVEDNGVGLPSDIAIDTAHTFGLQIARTLTRQLGGRLELIRHEGTTVSVLVPSPDAAAPAPAPEPPSEQAHAQPTM